MNNRSDESTLRLIGSAVKNIQNFTDVFFDNKIHCPFADNVMELCDNEENPTVSCDPVSCPLAEFIPTSHSFEHVSKIISTRSTS